MLKRKSKGFTLLEILLAVGILSTLSMTGIQIIAKQMELKEQLETRFYAYQEVNSAMQTLFKDFRNAFLTLKVSESLPVKFVWNRNEKYFYTLQDPSMIANTPTSDIIQVKYEIKENENKKQIVRHTDITRKESIITIQNTYQEILLSHMDLFEVFFWNGIAWVDSWDSTTMDTLNVLPKLVKVRLQSFIPATTAEIQRNAENKDNLLKIPLETIVFINSTRGQKQAVVEEGELKWDF